MPPLSKHPIARLDRSSNAANSTCETWPVPGNPSSLMAHMASTSSVVKRRVCMGVDLPRWFMVGAVEGGWDVFSGSFLFLSGRRQHAVLLDHVAGTGKHRQ